MTTLPEPYYQEPGITIYCGDAREILPFLDPVDLVLTDPPYGIGENHHRVASRGKLARPTDYGVFDWDSEPASPEEIKATLSAARQCIIWGGNYFGLPPSPGWLVWDKQNSGDFADCELAWTNLKMAVRIFRFMWNGMIRAGESRGVKRVHPTEKPVELMRWCLSLVPEAHTVIDPFCGSGPVLRAAKDLGRQAIGIDISPACVEIARNRLAQGVLLTA